MYSPNYGFKPRTRQEMIRQAWLAWKQITGSQNSLQEFQGSNIHLICNIFFNELEKSEALFASLLIKQFQYWKDCNMALLGSFGSSYEGWQNRFKNLCTSLDIISSDDLRAKNLSTPLKAGEIIIYFDDLKTQTQTFEEEFHAAFRDCKNIAEPTPLGDKELTLVYSNNEKRTYKYYNLEPSEYTKIDVKIEVSALAGEMEYKNEDFEKELRTKFNRSNRINRAFYAQTYLDITQFIGVTSMKVETKIKDKDTSWHADDRPIDLGCKYIIDKVDITRATV